MRRACARRIPTNRNSHSGIALASATNNVALRVWLSPARIRVGRIREGLYRNSRRSSSYCDGNISAMEISNSIPLAEVLVPTWPRRGSDCGDEPPAICSRTFRLVLRRDPWWRYALRSSNTFAAVPISDVFFLARMRIDVTHGGLGCSSLSQSHDV